MSPPPDDVTWGRTRTSLQLLICKTGMEAAPLSWGGQEKQEGSAQSALPWVPGALKGLSQKKKIGSYSKGKNESSWLRALLETSLFKHHAQPH